MISMEKKCIEINFLIVGITCTGCAMDMENIMLGMHGVEEATVNYQDGIFSITYDPDEIEEKTIVKKVKNLGFKTKLLDGKS
jgi:copper chaperone CopZ